VYLEAFSEIIRIINKTIFVNELPNIFKDDPDVIIEMIQ